MDLKKMNRNKLSKWTLCILLMFSILSFIPVAFADSTPEEWGQKPWPWQHGGAPGYRFKKPSGNWIGGWFWLGPGAEWEIPQDDYSFLRIGWIISDYEIEQGWDPGPPYQFLLFIDGEKVPMKRWARRFKNEDILFPDGEVRNTDSRVWMFTAMFDPYYFEIGDYEIRIQFLVKNPYQTSDSNKWRPYQNYMPGDWQSWYGPVGVVNDQYHILHVVDTWFN